MFLTPQLALLAFSFLKRISFALECFEIQIPPNSTLCYMRPTLLLSHDNLIEYELKIAQAEYKHLAQGYTPVLM